MQEEFIHFKILIFTVWILQTRIFCWNHDLRDPESSLIIIVFYCCFFFFGCATPNKAFDIIKLVPKSFFNQIIYGVNFRTFAKGPQCQIDDFNHYCQTNFQKNLKIGVGHFLWPSVRYMNEIVVSQPGRFGVKCPIFKPLCLFFLNSELNRKKQINSKIPGFP